LQATTAEQDPVHDEALQPEKETSLQPQTELVAATEEDQVPINNGGVVEFTRNNSVFMAQEL
jgi:hypothetical protein